MAEAVKVPVPSDERLVVCEPKTPSKSSTPESIAMVLTTLMRPWFGGCEVREHVECEGLIEILERNRRGDESLSAAAEHGHGVCHSPWNLTTVCTFHHTQIHNKRVEVKGRAPQDLVWTFPKLMQAVLERRRDRPSIWLGELDVRECSLETRAGPKTTAT